MLLMGKSTISMAIFNSYVSLPEGMDMLWVGPGIRYQVSGSFHSHK